MKSRPLCSAALLGFLQFTHLTAQPVQVTPIPKPTYIPIRAVTTPLPAGKLAVLVQQNVTLTQNQLLRVFGRVQLTGDVGTTTGSIDYVGAYVWCLDPGGNIVQPESSIGTNYVANTPPGPDYPEAGNLVLYPSTLIRALANGTYNCQLVVSADKPVTVVGPGYAYQGDDTTWLAISAPIDPGDAYSWLDQFTCPENDPHDQCLYVPFSGKTPQQVFELTQPYTPPAGLVWWPPKDAAFVDVVAYVQVTLCGHTSSCGPGHQSGAPYVSVVNTYLELDQFTAAGAVCKQVLSPVQPSTLTNLSHHVMVYDKLLTVPIYPSCGGPFLAVKYYVQWVSGPAVKIDQGEATAFTSYHGNPQPVPNVVGLEESAAAAALAAAGYAPASPVSFIPSKEAAGTVLSQDPAAGSVIEFPGSLVNLTVAGAGVTVPNVVGKTQAEAIDILTAAGLAHTVVTQPGCKDPGAVTSQNPLGGAVVAPGTSVAFTMPSGYTTEQKPCQPD